jgi:cholesterol transport system auxiliary component
MTQARKNRNTVSRRRLLRGLAAAPLAGLAAGCGSLVPGQGPPPDLYRVRPKPEFAGDLPKVDWQLQVAAPVAPASLDSTRIALFHNPLRMEYYARSDWVDRAPLMVQTAILEAFEESGLILSVTRDTADARPDYILSTELRDFQAEYFPGPLPAVHVGILAKFVSARRRSIVATRRFDATDAAKADTIEDVARAFGTVLGKILGELVGWTLASGEADRKNA